MNEQITISAMVFHTTGLFAEAKTNHKRFIANLGFGYGLFKRISQSDSGIHSFKLDRILKPELVEEALQMMPSTQSIFVLYSRQAAILAEQAICAYRSDLTQID